MYGKTDQCYSKAEYIFDRADILYVFMARERNGMVWLKTMVKLIKLEANILKFVFRVMYFWQLTRRVTQCRWWE
jgi:hypothetical protein